jgi:hypothetical protein
MELSLSTASTPILLLDSVRRQLYFLQLVQLALADNLGSKFLNIFLGVILTTMQLLLKEMVKQTAMASWSARRWRWWKWASDSVWNLSLKALKQLESLLEKGIAKAGKVNCNFHQPPTVLLVFHIIYHIQHLLLATRWIIIMILLCVFMWCWTWVNYIKTMHPPMYRMLCVSHLSSSIYLVCLLLVATFSRTMH